MIPYLWYCFRAILLGWLTCIFVEFADEKILKSKKESHKGTERPRTPARNTPSVGVDRAREEDTAVLETLGPWVGNSPGGSSLPPQLGSPSSDFLKLISPYRAVCPVLQLAFPLTNWYHCPWDKGKRTGLFLTHSLVLKGVIFLKGTFLLFKASALPGIVCSESGLMNTITSSREKSLVWFVVWCRQDFEGLWRFCC